MLCLKFASAPKGPRALRSLLQRVFAFPLQNFSGPPPHPCRLAQNPVRAGICFFVLKSMTSCWPGLSDVSETRLRPSPTSNWSQATPATKPVCPSPAAQAAQPRPPSRPSPFSVSRYASLRLVSGPVPQPACWRVYWGYFSGVLKQMEVCIPTMHLSWAEQPSKKCMSWQAASHVKWRCPNTQSWSWLFSDTNYCSPFYGGQAPLKMLIPERGPFFPRALSS